VVLVCFLQSSVASAFFAKLTSRMRTARTATAAAIIGGGK
jgi:hypothetical protein